jgi:hypothetical protein
VLIHFISITKKDFIQKQIKKGAKNTIWQAAMHLFCHILAIAGGKY